MKTQTLSPSAIEPFSKDQIASFAVFLHRLLAEDQLTFRVENHFVQSQISETTQFQELKEQLCFCEPQEIAATLVSSSPFQVEIENKNYDPLTKQWWPNHFQRICEEAEQNPRFLVKQFSYLTPQEEHLILNTWNDTQWDFPEHKLLHEWIEEKSQEAPHKEAVRFKSQSISYQELNERANQLAHFLRSQGVGQEELVGVCMQRSLELVIALVAILKAGGAYVPMDPSYPQERLLYTLFDSKAKIVLTQSALAPYFEKSGAQSFLMDSLDFCSSHSKENPSRINRSEDICYVIYTSGSTGKPKGVANIHKAVANRILWMQEEYLLSPSDRVLQKTPFGFDVSVWEFFWPLMMGACLVVAEPEIHKDATALADLIEQEKISILHFVPSMLELFLEANVSSKCASLKKVFTSGEALSKTAAELFLKSHTAELHNLYGPTEAAIDVTYWPCVANDPRTTIPIGYPIKNIQIYILDAYQKPVPIGALGELFIGGIGLAKGYINRKELTEEKFIPNPFKKGKRLYRTGDLCRFLGDGAIEYIGRIDHQVKLRGFRIELGEIEATLRKHPGVKKAAVIAQEEESGQKFLAAYLVAEDESIEESLISLLQSSLPEYMIPATFTFLSQLPLSPNGKLDVKGLCKPEKKRKSLPFLAPRSWEEAELQKIWISVLGLKNIGIQDHFFSLGGHSLKAMQLVLKIKQILKKPITLAEIFTYPTIEGQAKLIALRKNKDEEDIALKSDPMNRYAPFPLTDIQKAYLIGRTSAFSLGGVVSHIYAENKRDEMDIPRLEKALNQLIERHDMLRAVISEEGTQHVLLKTPHYAVKVEDKEKELVREEMELKIRRTDVWPLFEVRVSKDRIHFLFDLLIADGTGLEILFEELSILYENPKALLSPIEITYRDCILSMENQNLEKAKKYWFDRIDALPSAPELPLRNQAQAGPFLRYKGSLCPEEWKAVQMRAAEEGVSPAAYLVTLYGEALKRYSRSSHFTMNVMFFNRPPLHPQIDEIVGNFSATLLLEMDLRGKGSKAPQVQKQLMEDLEHASFNGIKVLNEKNRREGGSTAAAMPIVFACALNLRSEKSQKTAQKFEWYGKTVPYNHLKTPQVLLDHQVFEEKEGDLCFHWDVREGYFAPQVIERMFEDYLQLLKKGKIEKTFPSALKPLEVESIQEKCLHEAFFEEAKKNPHQLAVLTATQTLSYQELARASLHLSKKLEDLCLQPDDLIAIVMEKGWEQVAAVLGIHAAGAAYLPIDANLPEHRIRTILSISKPKALILQKPLYFETQIPCFFVERSEEEHPFYCRQKPTDLAYVIFTSGSTGTPKGVMIDHRAAWNTVETINQKYGIQRMDRCFASASLSFDLSVFDIFGLLSVGGSLYIPSKEEGPDSWIKTVEEHEITIWNSTPALVQILVDQAELDPPRHSKMRLFMMSGDWIAVPLADQIRKHFRAQIYSLGGATEASIWSNEYAIEKVDLSWPSIPYGKALANQKMVILDEDLEPKPFWVTGMIYIGGMGLARGYLHNLEKTKQSFVIHPETKERLYRTGDLGRLQEDGNIEFLGREDLQVKVQGYRIELEEIESAMHRYPGMKQAVVRIHGKKSEAKKIVAFFTAFEEIRVELLEEHLSRHLPSYMIPHQFVQLEHFPLSPNGKVDLLALFSQLTSSQAAPIYEPPQGVVEEKMAKIWSELLGIEKVGRGDNFFSIGGTSFLAFRMAFVVQKELGLSLPMSVLFQKGTIKELAHLENVRDDASLVGIKQTGNKEPFFLIHPSGGGVLCYTELASLLPDHPVYGFQAPGFLDNRGHLTSVEEMAQHYLDLLLKKKPEGGYRIGGWSFGGVIAYEMAHLLKKMGKEVAPVLLIDSPIPHHEPLPEKEVVYRWFEEDYGEALLTFDEAAKDSLFALFHNHLQALRKYEPPKDAIDLVQLKAEIESIEHLRLHPDKNKQDWGWGKISSGRIETVSFAATHGGIVQTPFVKKVAEEILRIWS